MKKILNKWNGLRLFHKISLLAVLALALLVAVDRIDFTSIQLPLPRTISHQEDELREARERFERLEKMHRQEKENLRNLQKRIAPFVWRIGEEESASAEIQSELQRLARSEGVTIRNMGSPRAGEVNDYLENVEISIDIQGNIREIGRFLAAVDQSERQLYWNFCRLRPLRNEDGGNINLSGRVEAFFLDPGAERIIFGREE